MNARTFLAHLTDHWRTHKHAVEKPVLFIVEVGGRDIHVKPQEMTDTPEGTAIRFRRI